VRLFSQGKMGTGKKNVPARARAAHSEGKIRIDSSVASDHCRLNVGGGRVWSGSPCKETRWEGVSGSHPRQTGMCLRNRPPPFFTSLLALSTVLARFTWRLLLSDAKPCHIECRQKQEREQRRSGQPTHNRVCQRSPEHGWCDGDKP
jgi:hypothetical protein